MEEKYVVEQQGRALRKFHTGAEAIAYMVANAGYAKLYAPDGMLLMTKGTPPSN